MVANCVPNLATSVSKQFIEFGGSFVNQLKAPPLKEVGNTRHRTASSDVYRLMCVVNASMCSSGSVVPS